MWFQVVTQNENATFKKIPNELSDLTHQVSHVPAPWVRLRPSSPWPKYEGSDSTNKIKPKPFENNQ